MASKQKKNLPAGPPAAPAIAQQSAQALPAGSVVLLVDRLDANRQTCAVGTVIAPDVEGWPAHRVAIALLHGYAKKATRA